MHGLGINSTLKAYAGPVFHYTTSEGLLGIVSEGMLRASEASSLNDLAEIELGWRAIRRWLARQPKSPAITYLSKRRGDRQHQVFVLSGTTTKDDANQWRLYADGGRGYVIELDGSVPLGVVSLDPSDATETSTAIHRASELVNVVPWHYVLYTEDDLDNALRALVAYTEGELASIALLTTEEAREQGDDLLAQDTQEELERIAHLFKAPGFVGENEVRLVARFMWFGKHVKYRAGRYGVSGYIRLVRVPKSGVQTVVAEPDMTQAHHVGFVHPIPIQAIRLGPLLRKSNRDTTRALLSAYGLFEASVGRSKVPLR